MDARHACMATRINDHGPPPRGWTTQPNDGPKDGGRRQHDDKDDDDVDATPQHVNGPRTGRVQRQVYIILDYKADVVE